MLPNFVPFFHFVCSEDVNGKKGGGNEDFILMDLEFGSGNGL